MGLDLWGGGGVSGCLRKEMEERRQVLPASASFVSGWLCLIIPMLIQSIISGLRRWLPVGCIIDAKQLQELMDDIRLRINID